MYGATDIGLVRSSNQDAFFFSADFGIVIVSDGMGGHKGGEIASKLVVDGLRDAYLNTSEILVENVGPFLDDVLRKINQDIMRQASENENLKGMGATVNYLQFGGGRLAIGHAGDSRTYLIRSARKSSGGVWCGMWSLTVDHNVGNFIDRGIFKPGRDFSAGNITEKQKSRLTRGMGVLSDLKADLYNKATNEGDVLLTCSDGLHGFVPDHEILKAIMSGPLATAHERLIERAKVAGAPDNVTVVISIFSQEDEPLREPSARHIIDKPPYLLRMPNGAIRGPLSAKEILAEWMSGRIPGDAEVASSLKKWVFFQNTKELFKTYTEFDCSEAREHVSRMNPISGLDLKSEVTKFVKRRSTPPYLMVFFLGSALSVILGFLIIQRLTQGKSSQSPTPNKETPMGNSQNLPGVPVPGPAGSPTPPGAPTAPAAPGTPVE
jgi:protein phosphatase